MHLIAVETKRTTKAQAYVERRIIKLGVCVACKCESTAKPYRRCGMCRTCEGRYERKMAKLSPMQKIDFNHLLIKKGLLLRNNEIRELKRRQSGEDVFDEVAKEVT